MTLKKIKHWQITLAIYIIAIAISSSIVYFQHRQDVNIVLAGTGENVNGFAWSENFGWISFNGDDCAHNTIVFLGTPIGCPANGTAFVDYGVNINSADGVFSGYAWSEHVGWINFSPAGSYPASPLTAAHYNSGTGAVTGWAKVVILGDNGWIKMNGVSINGSGDFSGWAWNGNGDGSIVDLSAGGAGWISFNSKDCDINGNGVFEGAGEGAPTNCPTSGTAYAYKVSANMAPVMPTIGAITEPIGACKTVTVNWADNSNNETGFNVEKSIDGAVWSDFCAVTLIAPDTTSCTNVVLPSTSYYFRVRAAGTTNSAWSTSALTPISYCAPAIDPISSADYNCDRVNLSWTQFGTGVNHYEIWRDKDSAGFALLKDDIAATTLNYQDITITSGSKYSYYIKAQNDGTDSNIIGPITPCPNVPKWQETKSQ